MSRVCELSGVGVQSGHKVSHSERKTKRKFLPNLQRVTLSSDALNANFRFRVTASMLKSIEVKGGLDNYLMNASDSLLSKHAQLVKKKVKSALSNQA
ncbi:MAG: rpmB [Rickettsiaceae bacterium]|jgi:large subunit ribosomal protein L28|nr:rpmB [Rickettsiaceae bacterium]